MPVVLPPIIRRQFIKCSLALSGTAVTETRAFTAPNRNYAVLDPSRVALLADTHISENPKRTYPGTRWPGSTVKEEEHEWVNMAECLVLTAQSVITLNPRPAHLVINGDCALSRGTEAEYKEFLRLVKPIRSAGITIHVTIGNHDSRENLWRMLPFVKKEQVGIHADVIDLPHANLFLLDSGRKGLLGDSQLDWLARQLDERKHKPALVLGHFNPLPTHGVRPSKGMPDGEPLLTLLAERMHAKAYIHGHTHEWLHRKQGDIHIIGQPAVSYYFGKGHAHGWVDMKLTEVAAGLELHCINPQHVQHGERREVLF